MTMMRALGTDVSHWQGVINWQTMYGQGVRFAFIKATQGDGDFQDPDHFVNTVNAQAAGILTAPYHFYVEGDSPAGQAQFLKDHSQPGQLPPMLDVEKPPLGQVVNMIWTGETPREKVGRALLNYLTGDGNAANVKATVLAMEGLFGRKPLIYSNLDSWKNWLKGDKSWAGNYPFFIAGYWYSKWYEWLIGYLNDKNPVLPAPFVTWKFWQFTAYAPGAKFGASSASLDLNFYNGDEAALLAEYDSPPVTPPPVPPGGGTVMRVAKCIQPKINARPQPNKLQDSGDLFKDQTIVYFPEKIWKSPDGKEEWWPGITEHLIDGEPLIAYFAYKHPDFANVGGFGLQDIGEA